MNNQKNTLDFLETIGTQKALTSEAKEKTATILNDFFVSEDEAIFENVYHVKFPYGLTDGSNCHSSEAQHQTCANILLDFLKSL